MVSVGCGGLWWVVVGCGGLWWVFACWSSVMPPSLLGGLAEFAFSRFGMNKMEIGCNLMISCRPSRNLAVRQDFAKRANAVLIATRRRLSRTCACTTDDDDERRTIKGRCQWRSYMAARSMPFFRWADTGSVAWPRWRGGGWRCALHSGRPPRRGAE